jgi:hypothetical protein
MGGGYYLPGCAGVDVIEGRWTKTLTSASISSINSFNGF